MLQVDRIHAMDAFEGLRQLPNESVDCVITDPPYNIADTNKRTIQKGKLLTTAEAWGRWDTYHPFDYDVMIMRVIGEAFRVLKLGGALLMFTSRQDNGYFIRQAVARGFTYRNQLVMVKTPATPGIFKNAWRSAFEVCMYLTKGRTATFNYLTPSEMVNVFNYHIGHKQTTHPTEKPLEFIRRLVSVHSKPGELVLDPFMGSGTTAVACKGLGRRFVGFELDDKYLAMAEERLAAVGRDAA